MGYFIQNLIMFSPSWLSSYSCDLLGRPFVAQYVPSLPASLSQMVGNTISSIALTPENLFVPTDNKGMPVYIAENSDYDVFFRSRSLVNELCFRYDGKLSRILINRGYTIDPQGESLIRFYFGPLDSAPDQSKIEELIHKILLINPLELNSSELELLFRLSSTREIELTDERLHRCFIDVMLNHINSLSCDSSDNRFFRHINNILLDLDQTKQDDFYKAIARELYQVNFGPEGLDVFLSNIDRGGLSFSLCSKLDLGVWRVDSETGMGFWSKCQSLEGEYNSNLIELYLKGLRLGPSVYKDIGSLNYLLGSERFPLGQPKNKQIIIFDGPELDPEFRRYSLVHKTVAGTMAFFSACWVVGVFILPRD
jgi:hypothetical protein